MNFKDELVKIEFLVAYADKTWDTAVHEVPRNIFNHGIVDGHDHGLAQWVNDNLMRREAYRQAVQISVYHICDEEEEEDIEPPDLERCQANIRNGSFMSLGKPTVSRCKNKPTTVAFENKPGDDGKKGSMSLCDDCRKVFVKRFGADYATIALISPVCGDCGKNASNNTERIMRDEYRRCFDCHKNWQHAEHCSVESQNDPSIVGYQIAGNQYCTTCIEGVDFNELKDMGFELETPYPIKKGDPDWGVGSVPVCYKCNHEINTLEEKKAASLDFIDEMEFEDRGVKVEFDNLDEGHNGDYNPDDPDDVNLLRFSGSRWNIDHWVAIDDSSYCTQMPAQTSKFVLMMALLHIMKKVGDEVRAGRSVKKICEQLSWISPESFQEDS